MPLESELLAKLEGWLAARSEPPTLLDVVATNDRELLAAFILKGFRVAARQAVADRLEREAAATFASELTNLTGVVLRVFDGIARAWSLEDSEGLALLGLAGTAELQALRVLPLEARAQRPAFRGCRQAHVEVAQVQGQAVPAARQPQGAVADARFTDPERRLRPCSRRRGRQRPVFVELEAHARRLDVEGGDGERSRAQQVAPGEVGPRGLGGRHRVPAARDGDLLEHGAWRKQGNASEWLQGRNSDRLR